MEDAWKVEVKTQSLPLIRVHECLSSRLIYAASLFRSVAQAKGGFAPRSIAQTLFAWLIFGPGQKGFVELAPQP
jgi:hypothetical protein